MEVLGLEPTSLSKAPMASSILSCLSSFSSDLFLKAPNTIHDNCPYYMSVSFAKSKVNPNNHLLNRHLYVSGAVPVRSIHIFANPADSPESQVLSIPLYR